MVRCDGLASFKEEYAQAITIRIGEIELAVLPLERVIASKEAANRDKDRAVLPALRAALAALAESPPTRGGPSP